YLGRKPVVVVADPDMLRQVMVRDFSSFPNRMVKPMSDCLLMLKNERWKRVRSILTPAFSASKMKEVRKKCVESVQLKTDVSVCRLMSLIIKHCILLQMVPLINTATDALMKNLDAYAESGEAFNIHKCFGCFTMDVIASVAFATQVDSQNNTDDPFVRHAQLFFSFSLFRPIALLFAAFPSIATLLVRIPNKRRDDMNHFFIGTIQKIIQQREEQPPEQRRRDFLQLMLDARSSDASVSLEHFDTAEPAGELDTTNEQILNQDRPQRKMITEDEIVGQAFVFLVAGYETSSNTLAFACYLLAINPECQRKLQEEVDHFFTRHELPDYTNVQELKYLDMVISETLRLYPPGFRFARNVERDCVVNGQSFPKGASLEIPAGFLHRDPEHWPDPDKFIPERFTPEAKASRHPFVYIPFGAGPRNCVGMRLAQLEMKMALVRLFRRFSLVACPETKVPLELKSSSTLGPKNGVFVKIERRQG
ncbi:unnamed protein product, partial [Tetraodon nigroviridis]